MDEYNADEVKRCYNLTAREYAAQYLHELDGKPFDRNLLDRFSALLPAGSQIYDMGCGSGQTTQYLALKGLHTVTGLDFSEAAIQLARQTFPTIEFAVDDMLASARAADSADGIVAFYAIVHFTYTQVEQALREWQRILKPGGLALFSFHVGDEALEVVDFLGVGGARATWHFLDVNRILAIAAAIGFKNVETVIRYPYVGVEHESKRAYILLRKPTDN